MSTICPEPGTLVEEEIGKVLTQYRESPLLLGLMRNYLSQIEEVQISACSLLDYFDLNTAVGDQLTIIGKILGFPRCHCICDTPPVVGYDCGPYTGPYTLVGYCSPGSTFINCAPLGNSIVCIDDDEIYRSFLKARRYQMLGLYDIESLSLAAQELWGADAVVANARLGQLVVAPGRVLTGFETTLLPVAFRVLPVALGVKAMVHLGVGLIAGYGEGWGGYCEGAEILCPTDPHTYTCA